MSAIILYSLLLLALLYWMAPIPLTQANLWITKRNPANELEAWLKKFSWDNRLALGNPGALPSYKFYTEIVEILLSLARKMGGSYQDSILFLREGLQADQQFEKKLKEIVLGVWLQMSLLILLTWGFITASLFLVEITLSPWRLILIGGWQLIGLLALPQALRYYRRKYFAEIGQMWKILYILRALNKVPLARSEIFSIAGVSEVNQIKQKSLEGLVDKLKDTCQRTLQKGLSYEEDVLSLMAELRFQEKWHFELFEKRLTVVKLVLMAIFFLPTYLAFVFLLLSDLLTLM